MATLFELAARIQAAGGAESMLLIIAKATLILAIAKLLLAAMPRASAATRHLIATATLIGVAAMPVLTLVTPAWNVVVAKAIEPAPAAEPQKTIGVTGEEASESPAPSPTVSRGETPSSIGTAITLARATGVVPEEPLSAMTRAMNVTRSTWKGIIVIALGVVSLLMLTQMVLGVLGVWFVARRAEDVTHDEALLELDRAHDQLALGRQVRLLRSSRISVPVIWGFFRPVLLLPADVVTWPVERLRVVLLHELAHLKRYDGISLILTRIAVSIFWYHPLAWSLERAGRNDCERACDDLVLASGTKPSEYADHLLAIARSMPTFDPFRSVTLAMSRKSQLEGRLLSILQPHVVRRVFSGRRVAVACAFAVAVIIPISALRLTAEPPAQKDILYAKQQQAPVKSDSDVTVKPDIEALEDYFLTKLGKYDKRIDRFAREPRTGEDWYERAYDLYRNDRFADAAVAFREAAERGHRPETSLYNAACSYALLGDADNAIATLKEAIDAGWDDIDKIAEDSDFDPIRSNPRFARAVNDSTGEVATRRVTETMKRYEALKEGKVVASSAGAHAAAAVGGVVGGVVQGVVEGVVEGVAEAAKHLDDDHNYDFDFNFDFDGDDDRWYEVGLDLLRLRRLDQSIDAFQNAIKAGEKTSSAMYNIACAYSLKGDARNGMIWLQKAIEEGFGGDEKLRNDPDIALLREQSGFDELRRLAKDLEMRGCCDDDDDEESWRDVVAHHRAMAQKHPNAGRAWFNLGYVALQARDFATGHDAFHRAIQLGHRLGTSSYNIACGYALQGDREAAFEWLNKARARGFELANYIDSDDDLDSLHSDPRWKTLRAEVKKEWRAKHSLESKLKHKGNSSK
ncbi:MAG TPA: M56 family metallopeptidase [Thermoanaerobaculia bacterium]|nr:M56 family metallopeptidase [Thermoanaerobaculia bacterium]